MEKDKAMCIPNGIIYITESQLEKWLESNNNQQQTAGLDVIDLV
jgi:hypothetical protein